MKLILALFVSFKAQAGVISWLCERFIIDSPYDFEHVDTRSLFQELDRLGIKISWNKADQVMRRNYELIQKELERRGCFN